MPENQDQQQADGKTAEPSKDITATDGSIAVGRDNSGNIAGQDLNISDSRHVETQGGDYAEGNITKIYEAEKIEPFQLTGEDGLGKLNNVPQLPPNFLPRPEMETPLKEQLLGKTKIVGVTGMGGMGKSVLAAQIVQDAEIQQRFCHGVLWVMLGRETKESDILSRMGQLAGVLTGKLIEFKDKQDGQARLSKLFSELACLVVLDDVWKLEDATAFNVLGKRCCLLITTRKSGIIQDLEAQHQPLDFLSLEQSLALLSQVSKQPVETLPPEAKAVAVECGGMPLACAMAGGLANKPKLWKSVLQRLKCADLEKIRKTIRGYEEYPSLLRVMQVSMDDLPKAVQARYLDFAIFPEDVLVPESVLEMLWGLDSLDELDVEEILTDLAGRSLL